MKEFRYQGFNNQICRCHYQLCDLEGRPALVIIQGPLVIGGVGQTSVTNLFKEIFEQILEADREVAIQGRRQLRVFEYYDERLHEAPIRRWSEAVFEQDADEPHWRSVPEDIATSLKRQLRLFKEN